MANMLAWTPPTDAARKPSLRLGFIFGLISISCLVWLLFASVPGAQAQRLECRSWDVIEREEGLYEYSLEEEYTTTDEAGNLVEVRRYVNNTTGEWRTLRRSVGENCRGDTDYSFGEHECQSITSSRSWTEEHSTDVDNADSGTFTTEDPDTGETLTVDWHVVERYDDYVVIEFFVRNTATTCQHRIGGRARYSFFGFQGFPPGTRILALDTNHSNGSTPYLCVTDGSGNCWLQARKPSGEWVGNFWSPGRVSFAIAGYGTVTGFFGNGFTYYIVNTGDGVIVRESDFSAPQQSRELGLVRYAGPPISLGGPPPAGSPAARNGGASCNGGTVHTVAPGDTLFRIAQRYGTTVNAIAGINNLANLNRIDVGQQLTIACGQAAAPQGGQTTSPPPQSPPPAATNGETCGQDIVHVVAPGENLFRIALRYGTTVNAIASANGIFDPTRIGTGQQLRIPCSSG